MNLGTIKRQKPRLIVLRGYDPNRPNGLTTTAPVASYQANGAAVTALPAGQSIMSGQIVSLYKGAETNNEYAFVLGLIDGAVPHIALKDQLDEDVEQSGKFVAYSVAGDYEFETPYFTAGTYTPGVVLTADAANPGNVVPATLTAGIVDAGQVVLGTVTRNDGVKSIAKVNSHVIDTDVIDFATNYQLAK
jgi:hypothetical protein